MQGIDQKSICYLMAVYNDPQGLLRTLDSLFADEPLADIVIVDDGSHPHLCLPTIPANISCTLLRLEHNSGIANALNRGLTHIMARSYPYIARIDAGDRALPGRLRAQLDYMTDHSDIAVLGTQVQAIDAASGTTLFSFTNPTNPNQTKRMLFQRTALAHTSVMIRTAVLKKTGLYDPRYQHAEDYELWRRIARHHGVTNLPGVYVEKDINPMQITARHRRHGIISKLRAQIRYADWLSLACWQGIIRSLFTLLLPRRIALSLRQKGMAT